MKPKAGTTRRLFFVKAGAALSAPLAVATAQAAEGAAEDGEGLNARLRRLEDVNAIRELNRSYVRRVNTRADGADAHRAIAELFADPAEAPSQYGIRRLLADPFEQQDVIEISADHERATARFHCSVETEAPIEPSCPLVEMAREQGGGVLRRSESGTLDTVYVKRGGVWKIKRLTYVPADRI